MNLRVRQCDFVRSVAPINPLDRSPQTAFDRDRYRSPSEDSTFRVSASRIVRERDYFMSVNARD